MKRIIRWITPKRLVRIRTTVLVLMIFALLGLLWVVIPSPRIQETLQTRPIQLDDADWISFHGDSLVLSPVGIEIDTPRVFRKGENSIIRMVVDSAQENQSEDSVIEMYPLAELSKLYHLVWTARLDLEGLTMMQQGEITQPITDGHKSVFQWELDSLESGEIEGTIWLYLRIFKETENQEYSIPVIARTIQLEKNWWDDINIISMRWVFGILIILCFAGYFVISKIANPAVNITR